MNLQSSLYSCSFSEWLNHWVEWVELKNQINEQTKTEWTDSMKRSISKEWFKHSDFSTFLTTFRDYQVSPEEWLLSRVDQFYGILCPFWSLKGQLTIKYIFWDTLLTLMPFKMFYYFSPYKKLRILLVSFHIVPVGSEAYTYV